MSRLRGFAPPLLLIGLGLALDLAWKILSGPGPIVFMRVDVGTLLLVLAITLSLVCVFGEVMWAGAARRGERALRGAHLEQADAHRRFIRRLDHEIKNPLTAIRAGLANLNDSGDGEVVPSVRAQVDRLAHLTGDLRKVADLETQPLEREPVDVGELLNEVLEQVRERDERLTRQIRVTVPRVPWPLTPVPGDRDLLFLAVHNLVDNALKYSRAGDTIELRAFEESAAVVVEVADTGAGIPQEELPQVWEELYRGRGARAVPGSGLGLALVQAIVESHGGTAAVRSRAGQGTVFTLRLPLR
jgi:two-component system, OmpR family, sensor kinase